MKAGVFGVAAGLMALVGCGGGGGGSWSSVSLDQLPDVYSKVLCDQNFKCASAADIMGRTKQTCLDDNKALIQFAVSEIRESNTKNRSSYDPAAAGACLTALNSQSCDDWVKGTIEPPACATVTAPKVAVGGACAGDGDCVGGYCDGADTTAMPPKDGTCKATVAIGAACTFADTCADDGVCNSTTMMCTAVVKKAGGEACTGESDTSCSNSCNPDTLKCSGYAGCAVAGVTPQGTLLSLMALAFVIGLARRRRLPQR
jgi:hypothetical protein